MLKALSKSTWFKGKNKKSDLSGAGARSKVQARCWKTLLPHEWKEKHLRQRHVDGVEVSTVMVVPNTADSFLLNELIKKEAQLCKISGYHIKLVEGNGLQLCRLFPTPLSQDRCPNKDECGVCQYTSDPSRCNVRSIVYVAECLKCWDLVVMSPARDNVEPYDIPLVPTHVSAGTPSGLTAKQLSADSCPPTELEDTSGLTTEFEFDKNEYNHKGSQVPTNRHLYVGESSRSLRERCEEHFSGAKRMDTGNFITKHWLEFHENDNDPPSSFLGFTVVIGTPSAEKYVKPS